ncbi:hypothetical protein UFOVP435_72 [uncultured Caudovirales phage]|uniref:Uncharacterized protein n=1 Tax=uncultured Caudovirales phage TaxID=2100421 RepID=A0A6J5MAH3_9CAUD|nr:hypothetical protein UFOVP435_72 [uncultured Caudovirales phage]
MADELPRVELSPGIAYATKVIREFGDHMYEHGRVQTRVAAFYLIVEVLGEQECRQIDKYDRTTRDVLADALCFDLVAEVIETGGL